MLEKTGVSASALERDCGLKKGRIDSIKRGSVPSADAVYAISKRLGTTMEEVLTGERAPVSDTNDILTLEPDMEEVEGTLQWWREVGDRKMLTTQVPAEVVRAVFRFGTRTVHANMRMRPGNEMDPAIVIHGDRAVLCRVEPRRGMWILHGLENWGSTQVYDEGEIQVCKVTRIDFE